MYKCFETRGGHHICCGHPWKLLPIPTVYTTEPTITIEKGYIKTIDTPSWPKIHNVTYTIYYSSLSQIQIICSFNIQLSTVAKTAFEQKTIKWMPRHWFNCFCSNGLFKGFLKHIRSIIRIVFAHRYLKQIVHPLWLMILLNSPVHVNTRRIMQSISFVFIGSYEMDK